MKFWVQFLACLIFGHRYTMRGHVVDTPLMDGPEHDAEPVCARCDLDFDGWDVEVVASGKDDLAWRLRNLISRYQT